MNLNYAINDRRSAARYIAVHLAYQDPFVSSKNEARENLAYLQQLFTDVDTELLNLLLAVNLTEFDTFIAKCLTGSWSLDSLNPIVLAILKIALFELKTLISSPPAAIINEYLYLANLLVDKNEINFLNAILDKAAKETCNNLI